jgi:outer membrane lipoprotein-sorting protein
MTTAARRLALAALPLSLLAAATAWAGAKEDMKALSVKFLALRSYHVRMESSDKRVPATDMDFAAPDRYRMQTLRGAQYIIGDTVYMNLNGHAMKVPMPKGALTQWRQGDTAFREVDRMQVEVLGSELVDGAPALKYRLKTAGKTPTTTLLWVGADGLPIRQAVTGSGGGRGTTTTVLRYSRFNDPSIRIDIPR